MKQIKYALYVSTVLTSIPMNADSSMFRLDDTDSMQSCRSFASDQLYSCEFSLSDKHMIPASEGVTVEELYSCLSEEDSNTDVRMADFEGEVSEDSYTENLKQAVAKHIGTTAYQAISPKIKDALWLEFRKRLQATGDVVVIGGKEHPVLNGSLRGYVDLMLMAGGASNATRGITDALTKYSGQKERLESELKNLLGINSLESYVESLAQKATLHLIGALPTVLDGPARTTLLDIEEMKANTETLNDRSAFMKNKAQSMDLNAAASYLAYEFKDLANTIISDVLVQHLETQKQESAGKVASAIKTMGVGFAAGIVASNPLAALAIGTTSYVYADWGTGLVNDITWNPVIEHAANFAAFTLSEEEVTQHHSRVVELSITEDEQLLEWNIVDINTEHYAAKLMKSAVYNTSASAATSIAKTATKGVSWMTSWWSR